MIGRLSDYGDELAEMQEELTLRGTTPDIPMLAEAARDPFDSQAWAFEPKWDGVRAIAREGQLIARSGNDITRQFPELLLPRRVVLDGEIVVLDKMGKPDFPAVAGRVHLGNSRVINVRARVQPAVFVAFDILEYQGQTMTRLPLAERRALLEKVALLPGGNVKLTPHVVGKGVELFARVREMAMEGIMAKRLSSIYRSGRSRDWLKIKVSRHGEFWVIGATIGEGRRAGVIGALVLAEETARGLVPVGEVGTGFSDEELKALTRLLQGMKVDGPIVATRVEKPWFWTEARLKVKVSYLERTADGRLRFPVYKGRR